jgi:hypothetical protein
MKALKFIAVGAIALLATLAVACGGGGKAPESNDGAGAVSSAGMVAPDTFLTYDGQRYELVNILQEDFVSRSEFQVAGEATEADVDMKGDMRVFIRTGDAGSIYTYSAPTADDTGFWLAWRLLG